MVISSNTFGNFNKTVFFFRTPLHKTYLKMPFGPIFIALAQYKKLPQHFQRSSTSNISIIYMKLFLSDVVEWGELGLNIETK